MAAEAKISAVITAKQEEDLALVVNNTLTRLGKVLNAGTLKFWQGVAVVESALEIVNGPPADEMERNTRFVQNFEGFCKKLLATWANFLPPGLSLERLMSRTLSEVSEYTGDKLWETYKSIKAFHTNDFLPRLQR
jgi:hypothetical protein